MRETLTSNPELFSDNSWNLILLGEETAKKWDHSEFNIEHIIHTLFHQANFSLSLKNYQLIKIQF